MIGRILVILTAFFLCSSTSALASPSFAKNYALVVGIGEYKSKNWPFLDYARKDALAMAKFLKSQKYEVRTLFDDQATRVNIIRELRDNLAPKFGPDDRIVFFFSGHGETKKRAGEDYGYIIPHDGDDNTANWISATDIRDVSNQMAAAHHQLFIFDSCYGGAFGFKGSLTDIQKDHPRLIEQISENKARQVIAAGGAGQRVRAVGPDGYSHFTGHLLRALSGKADLDGNRYLTASELFGYLQSAAANWDHMPHSSILDGHEQGDFWFRVMDRETAAKVLPERGAFARLSSFLLKGNQQETGKIKEKRGGSDIDVAVSGDTDAANRSGQCQSEESLTGLIGIAEQTEGELNKLGHCTLEDIANLTTEEEEEITRKMSWTKYWINGTKMGVLPWRDQAAAKLAQRP